ARPTSHPFITHLSSCITPRQPTLLLFPYTTLFRSRGNIDWNAQLQGFVPVDSVEGTHLAGALTGKHSTALALSSGAGAGAAAATAAGFPTEAQVSRAIERPYGPVAPLWLVPSPDGEDTKNYHNHYVDL